MLANTINHRRTFKYPTKKYAYGKKSKDIFRNLRNLGMVTFDDKIFEILKPILATLFLILCV